MTRREFLLTLAALPALGRFPDDRFSALMKIAKRDDWAKLPIGETITRVGKELIGTPYVGGTLDTTPDLEVCTVQLDGLDCVTFFETCLAFARMLRHGGSTLSDLVSEVTFTRYRGGNVIGYESRLHYTLDWMRDNTTKGVVLPVTRELPGAVELMKPLNFMTTHPDSYAALRADKTRIARIRQTELDLEATPMIFVPSASVASIENRLRSGDIVGIVTDVKGLDYSHTGLIVRDGATALFMHASSGAKKVVLGERISDYVMGRKGALGASFVRPLSVSGR